MIEDYIKQFIKNEFALKLRTYAEQREKGNALEFPSFNFFYPEWTNKLCSFINNNDSYIRNCILSEDWPYLIYASYFSKADRVSLLLKSFPLLNQSNSIKRGGLNLYKKDGWVTHVIAGLFISNICIPEGQIPPTLNQDDPVMQKYFTSIFSGLYSKLSSDDILVFRLGTLIHDLGVIDGVDNHDLKGVRFVQLALRELKIDEPWLKSVSSNWSLTELKLILQFFVQQHTLVSKLYGESGIRSIKKNIISLINIHAQESLNVTNWIKSKAIISLTLFLIGDIVSVRDELLTPGALCRIENSMYELKKIIVEPSIDLVNFEKYGKARMQFFLNDISTEKMEKIVIEEIGNPKSFFSTLGSIERLDYLLTYTKQIGTNSSIVRFLSRLFIYLSKNNNWDNSKWREIIFSSSLPLEWFMSVCDTDSTNWIEIIQSFTKICITQNSVVVNISEKGNYENTSFT